MDTMPIALILADRVGRREAGSALPHAPVVPHVDRRLGRVDLVVRIRAAAADALRWTADALAPSHPVAHSSARAAACREAG